MFQLIFVILALAGAAIHLAVSRASRASGTQIAVTLLCYLLVVYVGLTGLVAFYGHVFRAAETSASIGWLPSPFEYEVGIADLTVGTLGVLCAWLRGRFWLATAIANAVWLIGDGIGHIHQMNAHHNHAANNSGLFLVLLFIMPTLILGLAIYLDRRHLA